MAEIKPSRSLAQRRACGEDLLTMMIFTLEARPGYKGRRRLPVSPSYIPAAGISLLLRVRRVSYRFDRNQSRFNKVVVSRLANNFGSDSFHSDRCRSLMKRLCTVLHSTYACIQYGERIKSKVERNK